MIPFQSPQLSDKAWVDQLLHAADYRGCEYNFTNLYTWKDAYQYQIAQVDGFLTVRLCGSLGCSYLYPAGRGDIASALRALREDAAGQGEPLRLVCLTPRQMEELDRLFPGAFAYEADRPGYDYL